MPSELDDLFSGMESASSTQTADFFKAGNFDVAPKSFEFRKGGYKGDSFIARFEVLASNNPDVPVGSTRSWVIKLDGTPDKRKRAFGDVKNLFFALQGLNPGSVPTYEKDKELHTDTMSLFKASVDAEYAKEHGFDNAEFIGVPVKLECVESKYEIKQGPKKGEKGTYTKHLWGAAA